MLKQKEASLPIHHSKQGHHYQNTKAGRGITTKLPNQKGTQLPKCQSWKGHHYKMQSWKGHCYQRANFRQGIATEQQRQHGHYYKCKTSSKGHYYQTLKLERTLSEEIFFVGNTHTIILNNLIFKKIFQNTMWFHYHLQF